MHYQIQQGFALSDTTRIPCWLSDAAASVKPPSLVTAVEGELLTTLIMPPRGLKRFPDVARVGLREGSTSESRMKRNNALLLSIVMFLQCFSSQSPLWFRVFLLWVFMSVYVTSNVYLYLISHSYPYQYHLMRRVTWVTYRYLAVRTLKSHSLQDELKFIFPSLLK